ncbi:hypothetical protein KUCAC02_018630 [Chaenocephalus aceratus]|uniref:Uncharacterized protein n=1 Tax=Chaenocephalus aceratus TaxID=36190 RepID=A0ACB9WAG4_CHAAC|nr:hypothetical protein KUCAC02_018630 [Chaenocephalus aceratus]
MLLRVIISQHDIRHLQIENIPTSIEGLNLELRTNLGLTGGFILQFEDPDFNNELCNLTDIKDLPAERATLKVLFTTDVDVSDSTLDTCSLPLVSSGDSVEWPNPFPVPQFSHDVELLLTQANLRHAKDGSVMVIPKGVKTDILDTLADIMSKISAYPEKRHYETVAKALVEKHPGLKDPGSEKGWQSWFFSLKFKLGNYRQKLSTAGCHEVLVNKRKGVEAKGSHLKKSKKGEVNYCPDLPEGLISDDMEEKRQQMEMEMPKKDPDHQFIEAFSQRRREIVGDQPLITELKSRWPALFSERQNTNERRRTAALLGLSHFLSGENQANVIRMYLAATIAYELRQVGDGFYWRYKLLEILLRNYHNVTKIK